MHEAIFFFSSLAGSSHHNSSAWPCYAEGKLSAFSLSLASLRQQYLPLPRLPAYLTWQCLWLTHCNWTQTPLQHLLHNLALCPAHQYHYSLRWKQLTLLDPEKLPRCTATRGLHELTVGQRKPQHLALSGVRRVLVRPHGISSYDDGQH